MLEKQNKNFKNPFTFQTIVCEKCHGTGKIDGKKCQYCKGEGIVFWFDKTLFYWGRKISALSILENRIEQIARKIINIILFVFGLLGFLFFAYYVYCKNFIGLLGLDFWMEQTKGMLIFWLSVITDMYLLYRLDKESTLIGKVKKRKFDKSVNVFLSSDPWKEIDKMQNFKKINIAKAFTANSLKAIEEAWKLAVKFKHPQTRPVHILASLLFFSKIDLIFARLGINIEILAKKISRLLSRQEFLEFERGNNPILSVDFKKILFNAYMEAYKEREDQVSVVDLLLVIAKKNNSAQEILFDLKADMNKIKNVVEWIRINGILIKRQRHFRKAAIFKPKGTMDRAMTAVETPALDHFSQDLTLLAKFGYLEPCIGRGKEIEEIFRSIEASRQSVVLSGNPGVGKTTIINGIARLMVAEEVPEIIKDKRLISLSVARLVSGATPAEAQGRLMRIIDEIRRSGNIVLFIRDIQDIIGITSGSKESLDLSEVLVSEISKGTFFCFATVASIDYTRYVENSAVGDVMQKIEILEPELNEAIQILEAKTAMIEYQNKVYFSYDAIEQAVKLSGRYIHDRFLPEKAIKIIERTAVYVFKNKGAKAVVLGEDIAKLISEKVNIPLTSVTEKESEKLLRLEQEIHKRIVGQSEAVKMVSSALRRARAELRDLKRPIANFLFLGPTGVGKTELSKTVAEVYFGSEKNMVRVDMSEYQESASINRLIGSPPGQGGIGTAGYLTEAVRKRPFTLILLDEIEKAHLDILNVFLQLMDDGRLTDGLGRTIDFTNVILIATSNAGTKFIQEKIKENWPIEDIKNQILENEIKKFFRPEFINRFDGVIVFKPLKMDDVIAIAHLLVKKVIDILKVKGINLQITEEAIIDLAKQGFDPEYGARPLRRVIQEKVNDYLADYLLKGKIKRRDIIILDKGGKIKIIKAKKL
ncbi:MAG: AAA domain-containing protein [Xanthomonadaceae bacterium]|nr:AAA domain-containing protein [Rhodospirillaceae bacterium]NIA18003.1 AAA domain-containing protein [Xanthomonadaceae bacterium]